MPKLSEADRWRQKTYGITPEKFASMIKRQRGKCPICYGPLATFGKSPDVDHDHKTGKTRWLLCNSCNRAVGLLKDDVPTILRAALYLTAVELERLLDELEGSTDSQRVLQAVKAEDGHNGQPPQLQHGMGGE